MLTKGLMVEAFLGCTFVQYAEKIKKDATNEEDSYVRREVVDIDNPRKGIEKCLASLDAVIAMHPQAYNQENVMHELVEDLAYGAASVLAITYPLSYKQGEHLQYDYNMLTDGVNLEKISSGEWVGLLQLMQIDAKWLMDPTWKPLSDDAMEVFIDTLQSYVTKLKAWVPEDELDVECS